jgi:predicted metal-dependent enzyme (double-stranded beta helix superfamily)
MNEIVKLSQRLDQLINKEPDLPVLIEQVRNVFNEFEGNTLWLQEFVQENLFNSEFFLSQLNSIWSNDILLYRSPREQFTLLAYFWSPGSVDIIHDHGSWGVIAPFFQPIPEWKYKRIDDESRDGYAELEQLAYLSIKPGDTTFVLPLNDGIHKMGNETNNHLVSLNIYGRSLKRGYVQFYDQAKKKVWKTYPPRSQKQLMIIQALGNIPEPWAEAMLTSVKDKDLPIFIKEQCKTSLRQLNDSK